jgi:soluble lytic murein transglycosylase-like protein
MNFLIKYSLFLLSLIFLFSYNTKESVVIVEKLNLEPSRGEVNIPKSIIMYEMIEKYSDIYEIPKYIAYNVAYRETRYKGPFHWNYVPEQGSYAGALGPMQIMPATGRNNIELNVMLSMKILRRAYDKHGNWAIVCGKYNTGKVMINEYARYCASHNNYKDKWVYYE